MYTEKWVRDFNPDGKHVIMVAGNHEFYHHDYAHEKAALKGLIHEPWFHFLENETVDIDGVRLMGCTLWTDFAAGRHKESCRKGMMDFHIIHNGVGSFSPDDAEDEFMASTAWLDEELKRSDLPSVVVTHHAPSFRSSHPRFAGSNINGGFCSDLEELILKHTSKLPLWLHGHVHDGVDYYVGKTRILANPAGYPLDLYTMQLENPVFNKHMCVDVG
jgi:Icc-related predicted phosphoesterase